LFQFTGTSYFPDDFTIRHDDGIVLLIGGKTISDSYPTPPETFAIHLADYGLAAGPYSFILNYAAWNNFPEVLEAPDITAVPEPGILILLGISMASVVGLRRWWKD
jgi:hypothetical protein